MDSAAGNLYLLTMNPMQKKCLAVIFDMDGTLLDTIEDIADSMNAALQGLGFPAHPVERYLEFVGEGIEVLAMRSLPEESRTVDAVAASVQAMREEYKSRWHAKTRPYPGVPELLDGLVGLGIKISIFSNKLDAFTKLMANSLLSRWEFDEVRGLTWDIPRKPDPTGARICAERMGVAAEHCIFVGDSGIDMQTANRAGMAAFGVLWGYQDSGALLANGAQVLLESPQVLIDYLVRQQNIADR